MSDERSMPRVLFVRLAYQPRVAKDVYVCACTALYVLGRDAALAYRFPAVLRSMGTR